MADRPWSLRAAVTVVDATNSVLSIGVVPAAKTDLGTILDSWKLGIKREDEMVPSLQTLITARGAGQEDWKDPWSIRLKMIPQEVQADGAGLGLLPLLDMALDDNRSAVGNSYFGYKKIALQVSKS